MDSCDSPGQDYSWLAFSLSNTTPHNNFHHSQPHHHHHHHHHHHQLCLYHHPPPPPPPPPPGDVEGDNGGASVNQQHELSFLAGGELLHVGLFPTSHVASDGVAGGGGDGGGVYESQAVFVGGGFPNTQHHHRQNHQQGLIEENKSGSVVCVASSNKKGVEGFGHRTSIYRGVTRHRWTGRYEAHLWDNSCRREGQSRKGRQVYLGGYDKEEKAARAYDLAALKYWGRTTTTNFPLSDYEKELEEMKNMSRQEFVASLRRKSSGFSRGASIYRGVTRHHQHGRWQARIGRVAGNKDLYLGTFSTQEEAAEAYDIAAIKFRGLNAVTNFDISRYDVKSIISSNLPVGGMSNKSKSSLDQSASDEIRAIEGAQSNTHELPSVASCLPLLPYPHQPSTSSLNFGVPIKPDPSLQNYNWPSLGQVENSNEPIGYGFLGGSGGGSDSGGGVVEYVQQPSSSSRGSGGNIHDNEGYNGYEINNSNRGGNSNNSWIVAPSLHSFQNPKSNISVLQTPIFGIE